MDPNANLPEHLYALDYGVILDRGEDGHYRPDSSSFPDELWLVQLHRAGLLPEETQSFDGLPAGTELRLIELGAEVEPVEPIHYVHNPTGGGAAGGGGGGGGIPINVLSAAIWDGLKAVLSSVKDRPNRNPRPPVGRPPAGGLRAE
ncbi:hypothetical protein [Streptomyces subrutilus]|uniref:hypothetical protein n=1 Tax=Streptomyces subrutilus TaxID=36818 RepID=UPI00114D3B75|nr:hypothetical protein [Streptomyces subrutilus]